MYIFEARCIVVLAVAFISIPSFTSYLHQNKIIHGNVSLATIFIQHNGLVKIGSGMSPLSITITAAPMINYIQHTRTVKTYTKEYGIVWDMY